MQRQNWKIFLTNGELSIDRSARIEIVKKILFNIAETSDNVCSDPEPRVRFREFGESGLRFQLSSWIEKPELRGRVIDELSTKIYNTFRKENIEIPFPQRTLHIKKTD